MKKILLGLVMLLTTATMNAQIELEHVFEGYVLGLTEYCAYDGSIGFDDIYAVIDGNLLHVYNADFSLNRTINLPQDYYGFFYRNIFTNDNRICYISEEFKSTSDNKLCSIIKIITEDSKVLFENVFDGESCVNIRKHGDNYKLAISAKNKTYIYSCPGNGKVTTSVENVPAKVKRNAYPNPATDLVTLPYEVEDATSMKIYDMQGKLIERKFLDKNKQELQLNVKNYTSGMYFFEVNGESNSFVVK